MLTEYGVALKALRQLFADRPGQVLTVETLFAIYLVMICQVCVCFYNPDLMRVSLSVLYCPA